MKERNLLADPRRKPEASRPCPACRQETGLGTLPARAPLANPYVPFQDENPVQYEAAKGLIRGTLFPGLDLPLLGMVNARELTGPEAELRALAFAIQELALYLDTHREDREALDLYRSYQELYRKGEAQYVREFGPMNHMQPGSGDRYQWLEEPWPWDYSANR